MIRPEPTPRAALLLAFALALSACAAPDGPRTERLTADVAWLADDARAGRRAGTEGEQAAAGFIAARMAELGLEPAGEGGWFQELGVPLPARDGGGSYLELLAEGGAGRRFDAVEPLFCSAGGEAAGRLVFRGYGIQDGERDWRDYGPGDGAKLSEGSIALVVRGTPRGSGEQSDDERVGASSQGWGYGGSLFHKVMTARRFGAAAVLVTQHPDDAGQPLLGFDAASGGEAGMPALSIRWEVAAELVPGLEDWVRELDAAETQDTAAGASSTRLTVSADVHREQGRARNVLGRLPGGDGPVVVVGAHYDHLGHGGPGSLDPGAHGEIHNGADDNASGVAVVLEVARELARRGGRPAGDVLFALWSAEELGLLGSEHWCAQPTLPLERVAANLNLDMVGRANAGKLTVLGAGTSPAFAGWLGPAGEHAGLALDVSLSATGLGGSDHQSFVRHDIPALHLFSGLHEDYHRPSDDAERFEAEGAARVATLTLELVDRIQAAGELPFTKPVEEPQEGNRPRGFSVRFGTVPDYAYDGKGLLLSGTSPGSPAELAGMIAGDLLMRIDDVEIGTIHDFVYVLQIHKPGDVVRAHYVRDGEERTALVTLDSREVE